MIKYTITIFFLTLLFISNAYTSDVIGSQYTHLISSKSSATGVTVKEGQRIVSPQFLTDPVMTPTRDLASLMDHSLHFESDMKLTPIDGMIPLFISNERIPIRIEAEVQILAHWNLDMGRFPGGILHSFELGLSRWPFSEEVVKTPQDVVAEVVLGEEEMGKKTTIDLFPESEMMAQIEPDMPDMNKPDDLDLNLHTLDEILKDL